MAEKFEFKANIPENLGIPSEAIRRFVEHLEQRKLCLHSFMVIRQGEIAAEGYYPPFGPDTPHRMYSQSKTFVAMAIGMLIGEGKLKLGDRVAGFFPEHHPENMHPYLGEMTIRDLLMMSSPHDWTTYGKDDKNWVWTFFNRMPSHRSGTVFMYDTSATVALCAIVEKISGRNLLDYMRPGLLDKLGFSKEAFCIERPEGGAWGGSGVICSTRDMARFALFLLAKGKWCGEQLISEAYMDQATSALIDTRLTTGESESQFGYGYQIWRTRHNGFATLGMGSQMCVCLPDRELVLVTTGDTQMVSGGCDLIMDIFWTDVYPYMTESAGEKLPENKKAHESLRHKLASLEFLPVDGRKTSEVSRRLFGGKRYTLDRNRMGISEVRFDFEGDAGVMGYTNATGGHEIRFGICGYGDEPGEFPEKHYFGRRIGVPKGSGYRYKASGAWFDDETLMVYVYIIDDYFGTLKINVRFGGGGRHITLFMHKAAEWFLDEYEGIASGVLAE